MQCMELQTLLLSSIQPRALNRNAEPDLCASSSSDNSRKNSPLTAWNLKQDPAGPAEWWQSKGGEEEVNRTGGRERKKKSKNMKQAIQRTVQQPVCVWTFFTSRTAGLWLRFVVEQEAVTWKTFSVHNCCFVMSCFVFMVIYVWRCISSVVHVLLFSWTQDKTSFLRRHKITK